MSSANPPGDIPPITGGDEASLYLATIVECSNDAIIGKTLDGIVTSWNGAAERIFGYSAQEMIGQPLAKLFPPDRFREEGVILDALRRGERIDHYETVRLRKDGSPVDVSVTVSPIKDLTGTIVGASKIVRDITGRKLARTRIQDLQSQLIHESRVSAMGQLGSALAHELNQPLAAIVNYLAAARHLLAAYDSAQELERPRDFIEKAAAQAARAGQIIVRLRNFVQKKEPNRVQENLNGVIEEALALSFVGVVDTNVRTQINLAPDLPPVFVDKIQIQQVLVNLIRNSVEAMRSVDTRELTVTTSASPPSFIEVSVWDTGVGLTDDVENRLFKPFATTKTKGMGVGLAISQAIMESHGGRIWAERRSGGGAVFRFLLPVAGPASSGTVDP